MLQIEKHFHIQADETKKAKLLVFLYFAIGFYCTVSGSISVAVFDIRLGASFLPYVYMIFPFINIGFLWIYLRRLSMIHKRKMIRNFSLAAFFLHMVGVVILTGILPSNLFYGILLLGALFFEENFILFSMMVLQEVTNMDSIKRILPITAMSYTLGSIVAAFCVDIFSNLYHPAWIYLLAAGLIPVIAWMAELLLKKYRVIQEGTLSGKAKGLREAIQYIRKNRFYMLLISISIVLGIVFNINDYLYHVFSSTLLREEAKMVGFVGTTSVLRYSFTLLFELFIFSRLIFKIGTVNSVRFVLINGVIATGIMLFGREHLMLIMASKVYFCFLVAQPSFSLYQVMMNPIHKQHKDAVMIVSDMMIGFSTYFLGGLFSVLHAKNFFNIQNISIFSITILLFSIILWQAKHRSFLKVIEGSMNLVENRDTKILLESMNTSALTDYFKKKLSEGSVIEKMIALDLLAHTDIPLKESLLLEAFRHSGLEGRLKILELIFKKRIDEGILQQLMIHMDPQVICYMVSNVFIHFGSMKDSGVLESIRKNRTSLEALMMDRVTQMMLVYLCDPNSDDYDKMLDYLSELGTRDASMLMINIMENFIGLEDAVNQKQLKWLMAYAKLSKSILKNTMTVCSSYDQSSKEPLYYLKKFLSKECHYEMLQGIYHAYKSQTLVDEFIDAKELIPMTLALYAVGRLPKESCRNYQSLYHAVLQKVCDIQKEKHKIIASKHPATMLLVEEIEKILAVVSGVAMDYLFTAHTIPHITHIEKHLLSKDKKPMVYEIAQNALPIKVVEELWGMLYPALEELEEVFLYDVLDIGDSNQRLLQLYQYLGGVCSDVDFCNEAEKISILKAVPMFSELSFEMLYQLLGMTSYKNVPKGQNIIELGEVGECFYILLEGEAGVYLKDDAQVLATIKVGEMFGELAVIDKGKRTATVRALENTLLLEIHGEDFIHLLNQNGSIAFSVAKTLTKRFYSMIHPVV